MSFQEERKKQLEQLDSAIELVRRSQTQIPFKPAFVSWIRIILLPLCILFGWKGDFTAMFWVALIASSSDYLDGWLARRLKQTSTPGKTLDMLADKLFLSVMLVFLARLGALDPVLAMIPALYHIVVVLGLLVVSWSINIPVVAITTSERLTIILSYLLVLTAAGTLAYPDKSIFGNITFVASILAPIASIMGAVSYFRLSRRLIRRYMG